MMNFKMHPTHEARRSCSHELTSCLPQPAAACVSLVTDVHWKAPHDSLTLLHAPVISLQNLLTRIMYSLQMKAAFCRVVRPASSALRRQTFIWASQQRGLASHNDTTHPGDPKQKEKKVGRTLLSHFDLVGKVFVVTGGGGGLGLCMAEGLAEAGGKVHCLDRAPSPPRTFYEAQERLKDELGALQYHQIDVTQNDTLEECISRIAAEKRRLDGLIAAAAIQQVTPALDFKKEDIMRMMEVNYTGVFLSARACARQMMKYKIQGSICLIASMSGTIANKGFIAPVYNSSKAAVVQLTRSLAMEWGRVKPDGTGGIRVNSLSPGHIVTPMVEENFRRGEASKVEWEENSMLGRLSMVEEYKAAGIFLLSPASSYMTAHDMKMDGGTTAW
jgi:D-arabinitol 2-dehydrogenase